MAKRKNPKYPPWHCFIVVTCAKCGERFESICELKHICKKQNSYPIGEIQFKTLQELADIRSKEFKGGNKNAKEKE